MHSSSVGLITCQDNLKKETRSLVLSQIRQ